jgi:DNA-binding transcriptional MerR regulator
VESLMQTADVASLAGVTPDAIRRAVREGRLRVATITGRGIQLYRPADIEDYIRAREARRALRATRADRAQPRERAVPDAG